MHVHLVDGTYELFRHFFAVPSATDANGGEIGAVRGVVASLVGLLSEGATHIGVATDHVIESFRNELYAGYKTGEAIDPALKAQFEPLEDALGRLGVVVWPMVEHEADDAMASAAEKAASDPRVERVWICTPDKDLAQCVAGDRIVQFDRRKQLVRDAAGVREKFGVEPESIPDLLALVGDAADGFPGLPGWGMKSAARVLARYRHLEEIPEDPSAWEVSLRGARRLARVLAEQRDDALLFRDLATLRRDLKVLENVDALRWEGPAADFESWCASVNAPGTWDRVVAMAR